MKKIINAPENVVTETLKGFADAHADLVRADLDNTLCLRSEPLPAGHVALISGGGSGHEPLHAGFVGHGMLAAAVLGDVFASPNADQVLAACTASDAGGGVLLVVGAAAALPTTASATYPQCEAMAETIRTYQRLITGTSDPALRNQYLTKIAGIEHEMATHGC